MQYLKKNRMIDLGWLGFFLAWFCLTVPAQAGLDASSSCVVCHTHYGNLKKNLSGSGMEVSPLIEGMG